VSDEGRTVWLDTGYDPELAREASLRRRPREPRHAEGPTYAQPKVVAMAKCQAHVAGCRNTVAVNEDGMHALESQSAILLKRNERPLDLNECFLCESCAVVRASVEAEKASTRRTKTTEAIRYCKQASDNDLLDAWVHVKAGGLHDRMHPTTPEKIVEAAKRVQYLRKWMGEGYVTDLINCIRDKRTDKPKRARKEDV
jgi:hypothetical protein